MSGWYAHSDLEGVDLGDEPESDLDAADRQVDELREELKALRSLYEQAIAENNAATEWVREYERQHGPLKSTPPLPLHMIIF